MSSPSPVSRFWPRRRLRGAAGLVSVGFAAAVSLLLVLGWILYEQHVFAFDRARMNGQVWAEWVQVLDRADLSGEIDDWQTEDLAVIGDLPGVIAPLEGRGGGTPTKAGLRSSGRFGSMCFSYVLVAPLDKPDFDCESDATPCERVGAARLRPVHLAHVGALRRGAVDAGLRELGIVRGTDLEDSAAIGFYADPDPDAADPRKGLKDALSSRFDACTTGSGAADDGLEEGDIVALAHVSIPREERALHRRPPPGHPDFARMLTDLDMGSNDVTGMALAAVETDMVKVKTGKSGSLLTDYVVAGSLVVRSSGPHHVGHPDSDEDEGLWFRDPQSTVNSCTIECRDIQGIDGDDDEACVEAAGVDGGLLTQIGRGMVVGVEKKGNTVISPTNEEEHGGILVMKNARVVDQARLKEQCHGCRPAH